MKGSLNTLGGWGAVRGVIDSDLSAIPEGGSVPPVPTPIPVPLREGDLVQVAGQPQIFLLEGGLLRLVPDMATFYDLDLNPAAVKFITIAQIGTMAFGTPLPASMRFALDADDNLGAGHFMATHGAMSTKTGKIRASTRTQTVTSLGGFRGGVQLLFADGAGIAIGQSQNHTFGVDGRWIGRSDRTDFWEEDIPQAIADRTATVTLFQTWVPNDLASQVQKAVGTAKPVVDLIAEIVSIAATKGPTGPKQ